MDSLNKERGLDIVESLKDMIPQLGLHVNHNILRNLANGIEVYQTND